MRRNSGLWHLRRTEHTKEETLRYIADAQAHIADDMHRLEKNVVGGLYIDKYQILARIDSKLNELKTNFSHDAFNRFAGEVVVCVASLLASYRCAVCRDTGTVWDGKNTYDCECTKTVESFLHVGAVQEMPLANHYNPAVVPHPGLTLKDFLEDRKLSTTMLSILTNIPQQKLEDICNCKALYDCEMAEQFNAVFGVSVCFWIDKLVRYSKSTTES